MGSKKPEWGDALAQATSAADYWVVVFGDEGVPRNETTEKGQLTTMDNFLPQLGPTSSRGDAHRVARPPAAGAPVLVCCCDVAPHSWEWAWNDTSFSSSGWFTSARRLNEGAPVLKIDAGSAGAMPASVAEGDEPLPIHFQCSHCGSLVDGLSITLLVVEAADAKIHWMEPRDLDLEGMQCVINGPGGNEVASHHPGMAHVSFALGSAAALPSNFSPTTLRAFITRNGHEPMNVGSDGIPTPAGR